MAESEDRLLQEVDQLSPRALARLKAKLGGGGGGVAYGQPTSGTPKLSPALEAVADDDVQGVLGAIDEGLQTAKDKGENSGDVIVALQTVAPELAAAVVVNSNYRRKPVVHSLRVAKQWLEENHGVQDDTEETTPDDPAAPASHRRRKRRR